MKENSDLMTVVILIKKEMRKIEQREYRKLDGTGN